jgi:hypothetical protein
VITLTNQWVRRWYDREVERIGRGFIGITNGEIHMAHETMLAFWQDASVNVSEGTGHESLLIAHASCLLAVGRRYPAVFETQYWKPPRGHLAMSSSRSGDMHWENRLCCTIAVTVNTTTLLQGFFTM